MSHKIRFHGQVRTLSSWAAALGISAAALTYRLRHWPLAEALTLPKGHRQGRVPSTMQRAIERYLRDHPEEARRYA